jgi:tRNA threonylcarbamoyladenosine biosynthesis protein TsaB
LEGIFTVSNPIAHEHQPAHALEPARLKILALDTSTSRAAVAVVTAAGAIAVAQADAHRRHGRDLVPSIHELLGAVGLTARDMALFAVGLGPGSYTGLRIGLTAAKTLAFVTGQPLVGLDSLEAIARNAPAAAVRVAVVADAQRGDLYTADFARPEPARPLVRRSPTRIESLADWTARLEAGTLVLGPARDRVARAASIAPADPEWNWPQGRCLVELAAEAWSSGRRDDPWFLEPLYLRRSAAEDQFDGLKT